MSGGRVVALAIVIGTAAMQTRALAAQATTVTNVIGMEFVLIAPGTMRVGRFQPECPQPNAAAAPQDPAMNPRARWTLDDYARCEEITKRDAMPGFTVTVARPYYVGKYEVTQGEWKRVMGSNLSVFQGRNVRGEADRHPVDNVTWADAQAFIRKLNTMEPGARYRLPTEFEWEYAARAGASEEPSWDDLRQSAWEQDVDLGTTHPVGGKKPNAWGLYDTLGNVWEWVADIYNEKLFADPVPHE